MTEAVDRRSDPAPETRRELLDAAAAYARTVPIDVDHARVAWTISERAKRRAGLCRYDADHEEVTIALTWEAYRAHGWPAMRTTIRHELVHAWEFQAFGEAGHGPRFRRKARQVNAPRHCATFADARLRLVCRSADCDWTLDRYRASKTVKHPDGRHRCGECGDRYRVVHVDSGRAWESHEGYRRARRRIDDW